MLSVYFIWSRDGTSIGSFAPACCAVVLVTLLVRHSRMLLAGIQANLGLNPRLKHSGATIWGKVIEGPQDTREACCELVHYGRLGSRTLCQSLNVII